MRKFVPKSPQRVARPSPSPREARTGRGSGRGVPHYWVRSRRGGAPPHPGPLLRSERRRGRRRPRFLRRRKQGRQGHRYFSPGYPVPARPQSAVRKALMIRSSKPINLPIEPGIRKVDATVTATSRGTVPFILRKLPARPTGASQFSATIGARWRSPAGTTENCPTLQCWVYGRETGKSRQGRQRHRRDVSVVPAGTRCATDADPALKCWAIVFRPLGWGWEPEGVQYTEMRPRPTCDLKNS